MHLNSDDKDQEKDWWIIKMRIMNNTLQITANFDQPGLLENLVEQLAHRRYDIGYGQAAVPKNLNAIETSTTETYVSGTVAIANDDEIINMPFITRYLFTCAKEKTGRYRMAWSSSLS